MFKKEQLRIIKLNLKLVQRNNDIFQILGHLYQIRYMESVDIKNSSITMLQFLYCHYYKRKYQQ